MNQEDQGNSARLLRLARSGWIGLGVPVALGGLGGVWDPAHPGLRALRLSDPVAALMLDSQHLTMQALLQGRNIALRDYRLPALLAGEVFGAWPSSAMEMVANQGRAAVLATDTGRGLRLSGPVGLLPAPGDLPWLLPCPVQWSETGPPGIALLDGEQQGLNLSRSAGSPAHLRWASLDQLFFREDELLESDGARIAIELSQAARQQKAATLLPMLMPG